MEGSWTMKNKQIMSERVRKARKADAKPVLGAILAEEDNSDNPYGLCVGADCYEWLLENYPRLILNVAFRNLFELIFLKHTLRDKKTNRIVISNKALAICEGKKDAWKQNNYNGTALLTAFRDATGINIAWSRWVWRSADGKITGRARVITNLGISDSLLSYIKKSICEEKQRYLNGRMQSSATIKEDYRLSLVRLERDNMLNYAVPEQQMIATMLKQAPMHKYITTVRDHRQEAVAEIERIQDENLGHDWTGTRGKDAQERLLMQIVAQPKPLYHPVQHSYRLFGNGLAIIDRRVRRALTPGWPELDLKGAHVAIASAKWPIPELNERLRGGLSIWPYLLDYLEVEDQFRKRMKQVVKQATYAALYGTFGSDLDRKLWELRDDEFRDLKPWQRPYFKKQLVDCDIIQLILQARDAEMERAFNDWGTETPFGWLSLMVDIQTNELCEILPFETQKTHLSHAASAYELKLMVPCFEAASRMSKDVTITLLQHDGLSLAVRPSRLEHVISAMQAAVQDVADEYDIPTLLEVEEDKAHGLACCEAQAGRTPTAELEATNCPL